MEEKKKPDSQPEKYGKRIGRFVQHWQYWYWPEERQCLIIMRKMREMETVIASVLPEGYPESYTARDTEDSFSCRSRAGNQEMYSLQKILLRKHWQGMRSRRIHSRRRHSQRRHSQRKYSQRRCRLERYRQERYRRKQEQTEEVSIHITTETEPASCRQRRNGSETTGSARRRADVLCGSRWRNAVQHLF